MAFFKKSFVFGVISFATMGLVACGESSDSKSDASGVVNIIDESKAELSDGEVVTCDSELEGAVAAIVTGGFRRCEDGAWVRISRAEALDADKILGMGDSDDTSTPTLSSSSALSSSSLDVSSSSSWSGAIGSTEDSEKGSTDFVVDREKDIPVCSAKREGKTIYVEELDETFVCLDFEWVKEGAASSSSTDPDPKPELYKCPNGLYAETKEECPSSSGTKQSSSSVNGASSASTFSSSSASSSSSWTPVGGIGSKPAEVMPSGYYKTNCPIGLDCKYATTTEYLNSTKTYGEVLDTRDGQVYKTITIGTQTWMAQNLNYSIDPGEQSWCGGGSGSMEGDCTKYGRLYTWEVAVDACPSGWHLPTKDEWQKLVNPMASSIDDNTTWWIYHDVGVKLKTVDGWENYSSSTIGTNISGFSALPAGHRYYDGYFNRIGHRAFFWSSSQDEYTGNAYLLRLVYNDDEEILGSERKDYAFSVRCLKDSDEGGEISSSSSTLIEDLSSSSSVSSSSSAPSSSSSAPTEDPGSTPAAIKPSGYYKTSCPAGLNCKYASTTDYLNSSKTYGEILDARDGLVYKTIKICDDKEENCQTWMAENLNYDPGDVSSMGDYAWSGCYGEGSEGFTEEQVASNCDKYGRLYTWEVAMDKAGCGYGTYCNNRYEGAQGVCPTGWHLPTKEEWQQLVKPMATSVEDYRYYYGAGIELKTVDGWSYYSSTASTNASGFSALPAGRRYYYGGFSDAGYYASFWSASENGDSRAYGLRLSYNLGRANLYFSDKYDAFSVRCVQNN